MSKYQTNKYRSAQNSPRYSITNITETHNFRSSKLINALGSNQFLSESDEVVSIGYIQTIAAKIRQRELQIQQLIKQQLSKLQNSTLSNMDLQISLTRLNKVLRLMDIVYNLISKNIKTEKTYSVTVSDKEIIKLQNIKQSSWEIYDYNQQRIGQTIKQLNDNSRDNKMDFQQTKSNSDIIVYVSVTSPIQLQKDPVRFSNSLQFSIILGEVQSLLLQNKPIVGHNETEPLKEQKMNNQIGQSTEKSLVAEMAKKIKNFVKISINSLNICNYLMWSRSNLSCFEQMRNKIQYISHAFNTEYKANKGYLSVDFCRRIKEGVCMIYEQLHRQYKRILN